MNNTSRVSDSKLYKHWTHIKSKCYSVTNSNYPNNGGVGIKMCDEWKNDFYSFKKWFDTCGVDESLLGQGEGKYAVMLNKESKIYGPETVTVKENFKSKTTGKLYNLYHNIRSKLYNTKSPYYHLFGGRGMVMDTDWKKDFYNFKKWFDTYNINEDMLGNKEGQYTVALIDSDGDYTPSNCEVRIESTGISHTKLYSVWGGMNSRCYNPNVKMYKYYGGRGITVCDPWKNDFMEFKRWFDSLDYVKEEDIGIGKDKYSIDRRDANGDYSPANCRFAKSTTQSRNTRRIGVANITGYRGVTEDYGKFRASIVINSKRIHIGKWPTRYEASLAYDKYIKDNNIEHTPNNLILAKQYTVKAIDYVQVLYTSVNDYLLSGIYTRILNDLDLNKKLLEFVNVYSLDIPKITKTLKERVKDIDFNKEPVVVESSINKITINVHKTVM